MASELPPLDYEAEYNNSRKVPEYPQFVERWERESAEFRASHARSDLNLPYGDSERQKVDVFHAGGGEHRPLVVYIHGGYWQRGDRSLYSHVARGVLSHGYSVAIPSHDLCPDVSLTEIVQQVRKAVAFLHRRSQQPIVVIGHSAGGHLTAMVAATDWSQFGLVDGEVVRGAVPMSGLFDLDPLRFTSVNDAVRMTADEAQAQSPLFLPNRAARVRVFVGDAEGSEYHRQSSSLAAAWNAEWVSLPDTNHFSIVDHLSDPNSAIVQTAVEFASAIPH